MICFQRGNANRSLSGLKIKKTDSVCIVFSDQEDLAAARTELIHWAREHGFQKNEIRRDLSILVSGPRLTQCGKDCGAEVVTAWKRKMMAHIRGRNR